MIQLQELVLKNRSYRRFRQSEPITTDQVKKWIGLARLSASGRNMQPLKYAISTQRPLNDSIFSHLAWAGYLSDWKGPAEGERPAAYIVVLHDTKISGKYYCDDGIAMQSILLGAVNDGYGGCIIGSVNRAAVAQLLGLPLPWKSCGSSPWENPPKRSSLMKCREMISGTGAMKTASTTCPKEVSTNWFGLSPDKQRLYDVGGHLGILLQPAGGIPEPLFAERYVNPHQMVPGNDGST